MVQGTQVAAFVVALKLAVAHGTQPRSVLGVACGDVDVPAGQFVHEVQASAFAMTE